MQLLLTISATVSTFSTCGSVEGSQELGGTMELEGTLTCLVLLLSGSCLAEWLDKGAV